MTDFDDELTTESFSVPPAPVDQPRIEKAIREILLAIGEDPDRRVFWYNYE